MTESTATLEQVFNALSNLGWRVTVIYGPQGPGLNVWPDDTTARVPLDTIWPPDGDRDWVWGDKYQWGCPADWDSEPVATRISSTLRQVSA